MAHARITHHYADGVITEIEVGTDEPAHPDLLDELTARVCRIWRDVLTDGEDAE